MKNVWHLRTRYVTYTRHYLCAIKIFIIESERFFIAQWWLSKNLITVSTEVWENICPIFGLVIALVLLFYEPREVEVYGVRCEEKRGEVIGPVASYAVIRACSGPL